MRSTSLMVSRWGSRPRSAVSFISFIFFSFHTFCLCLSPTAHISFACIDMESITGIVTIIWARATQCRAQPPERRLYTTEAGDWEVDWSLNFFGSYLCNLIAFERVHSTNLHVVNTFFISRSHSADNCFSFSSNCKCDHVHVISQKTIVS